MNWWLFFALSTVACWGMYGIALHGGALGMADKLNGRYKAFLLVGLMYFIFAVVAPAIILFARGASWEFPAKGAIWSSVAGILGAAGAFGVLLAFGAGGKPAPVMSIVFCGAPIVNAIVATLMHPPAGGWATVKPQFYIGIVLAALGGMMVTLYKPGDPPKKPAPASQAASGEVKPGAAS